MTSFYNFFVCFLVKNHKNSPEKTIVLILNNITVVTSSFGRGDHTDDLEI